LKNKELLSTAIVFSQNGAVLKKIKSILISHKTQVDPHIFAELDNTLIESLKNNTNFHWEIFKKRFNNLDIGFMNTLLKQYPTLSPADQKLATLIKLGLSTKEISTIMQNTPASVQVARSRLRKKLKLDLSDNLAVILSKIQ
jgi:DNA-binding CsgD family transcriptional regulator